MASAAAFARKSVERSHRLRGQYLVIAAVREERIPFEDHEESHHRHGEGYEHIAHRDQAPAGQRERAEHKHEEGAGDGQDAEGLDHPGFGLPLRRERLRIEETAEEMAHQRAEDSGCSRSVLRFHKDLDTAAGCIVSDYKSDIESWHAGFRKIADKHR